MYALTTTDGTAASETALCDDHIDDPAAVNLAFAMADHDVRGGFVETGDNPDLRCIIDGKDYEGNVDE